MEHKSGCLICGKEIVYLHSSEKGKCVYCNNEFDINERCEDGHYICDKCHGSVAMDIIEEYCLIHFNILINFYWLIADHLLFLNISLALFPFSFYILYF